MIKMALIFLVLFVSVWLGVQLQHEPGYVLIAMHHWTIETTLWVGIAILTLSFILLHLLLLFVSSIINFPSSIAEWRAKRRALSSQTKTRQGLIEFSEGHWKSATHHLIKALPDADTPLLNYLTAARAAQEMGDHQMRDNFLRDAQQCVPEAKIAVELTQAQLQLANHQWEQALATLRHLKDLSPNHPYVLKLLSELYQEVKDWPQLILLLPDLKRTRVLVGDAFHRLQYHAYYQALVELIKQNQPPLVDAFMSTLPKPLGNETHFIAIYSDYLLSLGDEVHAERRLREGLRQAFNEDLVAIYGRLQPDRARLVYAESLLKQNPHSAVLRLALGRLSQKNQLWGKAKLYFEESIQLSPTPTAYAELGMLLEQLGDNASAQTLFRRGLLLAV